ncbi:MAG TPA: hypothetical protein VHW24_26175 [Bryobacteraceae bacterium]|jgi:hypothetical protein|nr:hypothetical protein [Bryobacteraceae bacterium]
MRRLVDAASALAIVASVCGLAWLYSPARIAAPKSSFAVNDTRTILFHVDSETIEKMNDVDLEDQLRDWLLYSVLSESGLDPAALRKSMYDLPPTRASFVKPVAAFEFGPTRSRVIDDARDTIALLPEGAPNRNNLLAQIADNVRSSLGDKPAILRVFEYRIDPVEMSAYVTRKSDMSAAELFSAKYGYVEKEVSDKAAFREFIGAIDDLVWVASVDGGVRLGGRTLDRRDARRLGMEDVAALWQSEDRLRLDQERVKAFEAQWKDSDYLNNLIKPLYDQDRERIESQYPETSDLYTPGSPGLANRLTPRRRSFTSPSQTYSPEVQQLIDETLRDQAYGGRKSPSLNSREMQRLLKRYLDPSDASSSVSPSFRAHSNRERDLEQFKAKWNNQDYLKSLLQPMYDQAYAELQKSLSSKGSKGIPQGSGFSLDPAFDYVKLKALFDSIEPLLRTAGGADPEKVTAAGDAIQHHNEGPFLDLLYGVEQSAGVGKLFAQMAEGTLQSAQFQHARYDGSLQGTEVGMTLFYTDLLAKLWALDYMDSAPDATAPPRRVRGFVPLLKVQSSPIYEKETEELSGTRLWFGSRKSAYSKIDNNLYFAPIATRVYAASSNTLQPGKEAEPNAESAEFLGWWNDHYGQVADYEPEYHRLNEIMKWSVVLGWLDSRTELGRMTFLSSVPVAHSNWFPQWAERNQQLRYRYWDANLCPAGLTLPTDKPVCFFARNYHEVDTESMPILKSRSWGNGDRSHVITGGVSLGSREEITALPELSHTIDPALRRSSAVETAASEGGLPTISTPEKVVYKLESSSVTHANATVEATATGKPLRGMETELKQGPFKTDFDQGAAAWHVRLTEDGNPIGSLRVEHAANTSRTDVVWTPLDIEYSRSYSRTLDLATSPEECRAALAGRPDVKRVFDVDGTYYIEPRRSGSLWLKIKRVPIEKNITTANLRFASIGGGDDSTQWNVVFLDAKKVEAELPRKGHYLVAEQPAAPSAGEAFIIRNKGPPPPTGAKTIDLDGLPPNKRILSEAGGGGRGSGPEAVAAEASRDPERALLVVDEGRRSNFKYADGLLKEGKFEQSRLYLDEMARLYPDDPEVAIRRVIAHAADETKIAAAVAARAKIPQAQIPEFLEKADMAWLKVPEAKRAGFETIVGGTAARADGQEVHFVAFENRIGTEMRLLDMARNTAKPVAGETPSLRYALANVDVNPELGMPAMPPPSESIAGIFQDAAVAKYQPDAIVDARTGVRYRRVQAEVQSGGGGQPPFRARYLRVPDNCAALTDDQRKQRQDCRTNSDTYEIESKAATAPKVASAARP